MSKSQQIREMLTANPDIPVKEIVEKVKCNPALIYQVKGAMNTEKKYAVKRDRPAKQPTEGQIVLRNVIKQDDNTVKTLKQEIIGYRAVISYLEWQLGLKDSQSGPSVCSTQGCAEAG